MNVMRTRRSESSSNLVPPRSAEAASDAAKATRHQSVLLHEAIDALDIRESDTVVDATLGGAGPRPHGEGGGRGRGATRHQSVLLHEAIDALDIRESDTVVDATLGGAG